jgi:hypothetical protein
MQKYLEDMWRSFWIRKGWFEWVRVVRHVYGFSKTGFYRPTALLVKPYINLAVTVPNHPFFTKTSIFKYFKAFF